MSSNRKYLLDLGRGVAAFLVLLFHMFGSIHIFRNFYLSVDFFFVLSGFVLAAQIHEIHDYHSFMHFLKRRFIRIYPMVFAVILFSLSYDGIHATLAAIRGVHVDQFIILNPSTLVASILLLQVFHNKAALVDGPIWSLSAEWIVNIVVASTSLLMSKRVRILVLISLLLLLGFRYPNNGGMSQLFRAAIGFSLGLLVFQLPKVIKFRHFLTILAPILVCVLLVRIETQTTTSTIIASISFSLLVYVLGTLCENQYHSITKRLSIFAARYSYGFYLWHFPALSLVGILKEKIGLDLGDAPGALITLALVIITALALTRLSIDFIERPLQTRLGY